VVMPYVLAFNRTVIDERIGRLAGWLGLETNTFDAFLNWVIETRAFLEIPHTSDQIGLNPEHIPDLAKRAAEDAAAGGNPIPVNVDDFTFLYQQSLSGSLSSS